MVFQRFTNRLNSFERLPYTMYHVSCTCRCQHIQTGPVVPDTLSRNFAHRGDTASHVWMASTHFSNVSHLPSISIQFFCPTSFPMISPSRRFFLLVCVLFLIEFPMRVAAWNQSGSQICISLWSGSSFQLSASILNLVNPPLWCKFFGNSFSFHTQPGQSTLVVARHDGFSFRSAFSFC